LKEPAGSSAAKPQTVKRQSKRLNYLSMPGINGLSTARLLKRALPTVHLILFTGHGDLFKSNEANSAGISAVFSKTQPIIGLLDKAKALVSYGAVSNV
jgi:DNA-binding NarL/FixJ family response regulator